MSELPAELKYLSSHEWVRVEGDVATIGISDHAQEAIWFMWSCRMWVLIYMPVMKQAWWNR